MNRYKEFSKYIEPFVIDSVDYIYNALESNKKIMIEGANANMLDIDFGTYPFVTSSSPSIGGCITGLGIPPTRIGRIIGIVKAYTTRVGEGPFPTELFDDTAKHLQEVGKEYGTTTGRKRRCGWLDLTQLQYSVRINGFTELALTKLDVLSGLKEIKIGVHYYYNKEKISFPASIKKLENIEIEYKTLQGWDEDISKCRTIDELPENARIYINEIEKFLNVKIKYIGVGPERNDIIIRD